MKTLCYVLVVCLSFILCADLQAQSASSKGKIPWAVNDGAVSFSIGNKVYYGGGTNKDFYEYDVTTSTWTKKAPIPGVTTARAFGIGFSIGNKGYVGCGSDGQTMLNDLWEYDPMTDKWAQKADFTGGGRNGNAAFVIGSKAYVVGGFDGAYYWGDFYQYDPSTDKWTQRANFTGEPMIFPSAFALNQYGYVIGGQGAQSGENADLYRYDPEKDIWEDMPSCPGEGRQCAVAFTLNGKGYFGLGQTKYTTVFDDIYAFDPVSNSWSTPIKTGISGRAWASAITANGSAYIVGGAFFQNNGLYGYNDIWEFNLATADVKMHSSASDNIALFPNPARNTVMIQAPSVAGAAAVTVVDAAGHVMLSSSMMNGTMGSTLNISNLPTGEYFLKINGSNNQVLSKKLIKQ